MADSACSSCSSAGSCSSESCEAMSQQQAARKRTFQEKLTEYPSG